MIENMGGSEIRGGIEGEAARLARIYISKLDKALNDLKVRDEEGGVGEVVEEARRYLSDSRYYLEGEAYLAALAAASYAEGLLDSLRMLGLAEFEWPRGKSELAP
ncbi:MAG: DUF357 domain-containing protein [Candidatus Bathyarchaeia archaeon]